MKIAFCGNVANALAPICRSLRGHGIDAHLFVDSGDPQRWRPETDDPSIAHAYPDWIHEGRWLTNRDLLHPGRSALVTALREFDLVVGSGNTPTIAPFLHQPFVFFTTGADLTKQPFPVAFRSTRSGLVDQLGHAPLAFWQRRGIRHAAEIWTQPFRPFLDALARLGVDQRRISPNYFPLIVDTELFADDLSIAPWALEMRGDSDFAVFHPSRLVLDETPLMLRSGQTKGSGSILRGFADFVASGAAERPVILLPALDRGAADAAALVEDLDIADHVRWVEAPRPSGFHRTEMAHLYGVADVTVNELGAGWFGWAALESMSCGTPVVSRIDRAGIEKLYGDDSEWIHADDADAVSARLSELASDPNARRAQGAACRRWIERHHAIDTAGLRMATAVKTSSAELLGTSLEPQPSH